MRRLVLLMTALVAATGIVVASTGAAGAASSRTPYTCGGGDIPSGAHASITGTGVSDAGAGAAINVVGNFTVSDVMPEWLGVLFSQIGGNLTLINITATDPDDDGNAAVSVVVNTVGRNLNCEGLGPRLTGGAFPGEFNIVGHKTTGQCVGLLSGF